jgi:hypothetical protein
VPFKFQPCRGFFKALGAGERWITVHPNGRGENGVPIMIRETTHGSGTYHVIGGAGGKLNYLKLRGVKSEADYRQEVAEQRGLIRFPFWTGFQPWIAMLDRMDGLYLRTCRRCTVRATPTSCARPRRRWRTRTGLSGYGCELGWAEANCWRHHGRHHDTTLRSSIRAVFAGIVTPQCHQWHIHGTNLWRHTDSRGRQSGRSRTGLKDGSS